MMVLPALLLLWVLTQPWQNRLLPAGVGMLIGRDATIGKIFVNSMTPEGPASKSGIKSGDQLLAVA